MKTNSWLNKLIILAMLLAMGGCKSEPKTPNEPPEPPRVQTASTYFPVLNDTRLFFQGEGNEYATFDIYVDFSEENRIQQRIDNGGTVIRRVLEIEEDEITEVFYAGEAYWRFDNLNQKSNTLKTLLKSPIEVGNKWAHENDVWSEITAIDMEINTPSGTYKGIEVTTEYEGSLVKHYYAEEVGLVKQVFESEGVEVRSELAQVLENTPFQESLRLYYPGFEQYEIFYIETQIPLRSNERLEEALTLAYQTIPSQDLGIVLGEGAKIKSIQFIESDTIQADLNSAFIEEMNAGAAYESMILQSMVNTLADYFQTQKVILTVEGKLYESGHFMLEEGTYFEGRLEDTIEWTP